MAARSFGENDEDDLGAVLHEEINRLPQKYRSPVVLCYLEGQTHDQAAQQLGWPVGSVRSRLSWARERLRSRLIRRGLSPTLGLLGLAAAPKAATACMPVALTESTVRAACLVAAGRAAAGVVSMHAAELMERGLRAMSLAKIKRVATLLLATGAIAIGAAGFALKTTEAQQQPARPKDERPTDATTRARSAENLKRLGIALNKFDEANGFLPPSAIRDSNTGTPLLSWRVALLPWVGAEDLYRQFNFNEPWDGPHNKALLAKMPEVYAPAGAKTGESYVTYYQVFVGPGTAFEPLKGSQKLRAADVTDGAANTVAIVEAANAVPWTKPEDLPYAPDKPITGLSGHDEKGNGFPAVFLDASVRHLKRRSARETLEDLMRAPITRNGGEAVSADNPPK